MVKKLDKAKARAKRHQRVRNKINGTAAPLSIFMHRLSTT